MSPTPQNHGKTHGPLQPTDPPPRKTALRYALDAAVIGAVVLGLPRVWPRFIGTNSQLEWLAPAALVVVAAVLLGAAAVVAEAKRLCRAAPVLAAFAAADVVWVALSTLWSMAPHQSVLETGRMAGTSLAVIVFAAALRDTDRQRRVLRILAFVAGIGGAAALLCVALALTGGAGIGVEGLAHSQAGGWPRATGGLGTPATFGMAMLVFGAFASLAGAVDAISLRLSTIFTGLALLACVASASVPSLVAIVVAAVWLSGRRRGRLAAWLGSAIAAAEIMIIYKHVHSLRLGVWVMERSAELGYVPLGLKIHPLHVWEASFAAVTWHATGYAAIHRAHFNLLLEHPRLGVGAGAFQTLQTGLALRTTGYWSTTANPHGWLLARASEGGCGGAVIAGGIAVLAAIAAHRLYRNRAWPELGFAAVTGIGLVALGWFADPVHRWDCAFFVAALAAYPKVAAAASGQTEGGLHKIHL